MDLYSAIFEKQNYTCSVNFPGVKVNIKKYIKLTFKTFYTIFVYFRICIKKWLIVKCTKKCSETHILIKKITSNFNFSVS